MPHPYLCIFTLLLSLLQDNYSAFALVGGLIFPKEPNSALGNRLAATSLHRPDRSGEDGTFLTEEVFELLGNLISFP